MTSVIRLNEAVDQDAMRKARALFTEIDDDTLDEIPGLWMDEILKRKDRNENNRKKN